MLFKVQSRKNEDLNFFNSFKRETDKGSIHLYQEINKTWFSQKKVNPQRGGDVSQVLRKKNNSEEMLEKKGLVNHKEYLRIKEI